MRARIEQKTRSDLISSVNTLNLQGIELETFRTCVKSSTWLWGGIIGTECVCVVGLIPPTLLSDQAYLWLHTTPALKANEFLFIRHSQRLVEKALDLFPSIVGVTDPANDKAIRWLKWLGAKFTDSGPMLSFEIRKA